MHRSTIVQTLCALLILAASAMLSPALAQGLSGPATATTNVNLREGPGTNHRVINVVMRGDQVRIVRCTGSWCLVDAGRDRGWLSRQFLQPVVSVGRPRPPNINITIDRDGPGISVGGRACFYERNNFRGRNFCMQAGESRRNLGNWNNRIGSVSTRGRGTRVELCTERNFRNCSTFSGDVPVLNMMLSNNVSSVRVR